MIQRSLIAVVVALTFAAAAARGAESDRGQLTTDHGQRAGLDPLVKPFFAQHCTKCHGPRKHEGDLRVDTLVIDFQSPKTMGHWEEIMNRINSGDMP
ncbi:MAG TPA: c-type cytochrome domain-containing protein, partial [Pirellulales bacterium]